MYNTSLGSGIGALLDFNINVGNAGCPTGNAEYLIPPNFAACAPAPTFQSCIVESPWAPAVFQQPAQQHTHYHMAPAILPSRLSDEDIERIAKRVVELLKDSK